MNRINFSCRSVQELVTLTRTLPMGHYDINKARAAIDEKYRLSRQTEIELMKRFNYTYRSWSLSIAKKMCNRICDKLGVRPVKDVVCGKIVCRAEYCNGVITSSCLRIGTTTLLHELAHHVATKERMGCMHDKGFCEALTLVWEAAYATYKL